MLKKLDWKFLLSITVAIAGLFIPWWLTKLDNGEKSLTVQILSQSSLQLSAKELVPGLEITIEGAPVKDPYFSVIKLANEGDKAITTKDFENPLEISISPSSGSIVRARVTTKSPDDIQANIDASDKQTIRIAPTLLNPKDSITFSILTSGGKPSFSARARIIGISKVPVSDATTTTAESPNLKWWLLLIALIYAIPSLAAYLRYDLFPSIPKGVLLQRRTVLALVLTTGFVAIGSLIFAAERFGYKSFWQAIVGALLLSVVAAPFVWILEQRKPLPTTDDEKKPRAKLPRREKPPAS